jgi:hypothetical protein
VLALRDLARYVDASNDPPDPLAIIRQRQKELASLRQAEAAGPTR